MENKSTKEIILEKSRLEKTDEGMEHAEMQGLKHGFYSCGGFNTPTLCVVTKGIKADCNHLMRTYNAKH